MKNLFLLFVAFMLLGSLMGCKEDIGTEAPLFDIDVYGMEKNILYSRQTVSLPPDTVIHEDSTVTETDTIYFDVIDTIYKERADSIYIPKEADTLKFVIRTNCSWQFEFAPVYWDLKNNNGVLSPTPLDWFVRPDKVTGGGNSFITIPIKENTSNQKRAVLFYFKTKSPYVKNCFMITQAPNS